MSPAVLASFPTFPVLALAGPLPFSYDPIYIRGRDSSSDFDDDDADYHLTGESRRARTSASISSLSSRASRLTRRISGSSTCSSISSKTGGLTRGARRFIGDLFRSRPSENEWKRVEEEAAAARQQQHLQAPVVPLFSRMADGYSCFDSRATTAASSSSSSSAAAATNWKSPARGTRGRKSTSRFYEHTDDYYPTDDDDHHHYYDHDDDDHDEALTPLFRCPAGFSMSSAASWSTEEKEGRERNLSMTEAWAWW